MKLIKKLFFTVNKSRKKTAQAQLCSLNIFEKIYYLEK